MKSLRILSAVCLLLAAGCGHSVMIPPRIDLAQHEILGVIEFQCSAQGPLGGLTTKKFVEAMRRDQGMVRVVGLGPKEDVLKNIGQVELNRQAYIALGKDQGIKTVVVGELTISNVRAAVNVTPDLGSAGLSAQIDATLSVEMIEAASGASLWSKVVNDSRTVGNISLFGGKQVVFDADDPEKAYGKLVNSLVAQATADFRVSWTKR
jgi:hypothetical protein